MLIFLYAILSQVTQSGRDGVVDETVDGKIEIPSSNPTAAIFLHFFFRLSHLPKSSANAEDAIFFWKIHCISYR